jgi:hypothetical protein
MGFAERGSAVALGGGERIDYGFLQAVEADVPLL